MKFVRWGALLALMTAPACAGPLGHAPIVLTEVPNQPGGEKLIAMGAERTGCRVSEHGRDMRLACPDGSLDVPTFSGPPTFAVRCTDSRLDVARCTALVRKILLATEGR